MDADTIRIRTATPADAQTVLALWRAADAVPSVTDDEVSVRGLLERDPEALLLAVDGDRIVGTLIAGWDGWRGNMARLAVLPDLQRRGIATTLVAAARARLAALGARRVTALVVTGRAQAEGLWSAVGFAPDPVTARYVMDITRA
jgi:ribosomal protein S18 acetylase RimI-like enzyme